MSNYFYIFRQILETNLKKIGDKLGLMKSW